MQELSRAEKVRLAFKESRLSIEDFSKKLGLKPRRLRGYIEGEVQPRVKTLAKIEVALFYPSLI